MSLKDFKKIASRDVTISQLTDENDEPITITVHPLNMNKAIDIISNYNIFAEELIFNSLDFERLDEIEYVQRFGFDKFDEVISYCIALACNEEGYSDIVQHHFPWEKKVEAFSHLLDLSLPEDKKKAERNIQNIVKNFGEPILNLLKAAGSQTEKEEEESTSN